MKRSRSVSVTGATGFLGGHVVDAFLSAGWHVRAVVRPGRTSPADLPPDVEIVTAGLDDRAALADAFESSAVAVHLAAVTRARDAAAFQRINVDGTRTVVAAANDAGTRLVVVSSQAAIGPSPLIGASREDDPPRPLTAYGRSKLAAEQEVRVHARVPWTILRPSAVYGPRDRQFLPLFKLASRGIAVLATDPTTPYTLVYVEDVARAIVLAATANDERSLNQTLFIGHPEPASAWQIVQAFAEAFDRPCRPWRIPPAAVAAAAWIGGWMWRLGREPAIDADRLAELRADGFVCAVDRAREVLDFTAAVGLRAGAGRTARWYRDQGWV